MRFGISLWGNYPLRQWIEYVRIAEDAGFHGAWIGDTQLLTPDVYATLAMCVDATTHIQLGPGVTNTVTRDPTVTAGSILSIQQLASGRCRLGIGVGGSSVGAIGLPEERLGEFRRKVSIIKHLVQGAAVEMNGVVVASKIDAPRVPVYIGSASRLGLELAGEIGDGVIMNVGVNPVLVREGIRHVEQGATKGGRSLSSLDIGVIVGCCIDDDQQRALDACRPWAAMTARRAAKWMQAGSPKLREAGTKILAGYKWDEHLASDAHHARDMPEEIVGDFALAGSAEQCRAAVRQLEDCGVTEIAPIFMGADLPAAIRGFGRDIISRLA